jgi:GH15 family glucan-1,4-alpha-glucosidase
MITLVAGNGRILLTVNEHGDWNELFYPFPGQFQQLREARLGLFDVRAAKFSWLRRGNGYAIEQRPFGAGQLPESIWTGEGIRLSVRDHVHPNHDLIVRVVRLRAEPARPVRLFAYHAFQIAESMYQDTAYVDPVSPSLVHYKRGYYFEFFADPPFTHAACGEHTLKGLQGSYVDAEDGRLEGRTVAHGAADSVMEWDIEPPATGEAELRIFLAAARSLPAVHEVRDYVRHGGPSRFVRESERFWESWTERRLPHPPSGLSELGRQVYRSSVLLMRHVTGANGAIVASPDTRSLVAAAWHHFKRGGDPDTLVTLWPLVKGAANFLAGFRDPATQLPRPSFDLWEERMGVHAYSTAAVAHALERAARIASEIGKDPGPWRTASVEVRDAALRHLWDPALGRFVRSLEPRDEKLDASILLALKLGLLPWDDPRVKGVVDAVEARLWVPGTGGLARYEGDAYYGHENPWIVCTLWLAEARLRLGDPARCRELIEWTVAHATPTFLLPEQVDRVSGEPRSATPLAWSHSTFVDVVHKFAESERGAGVHEE